MNRLFIFVLAASLLMGSLLFVTTAMAQQKKQVLLIGTFHFNNPNADAIKTEAFDVTTAGVQKELEQLATCIKDFAPSKIFVEWDYDQQQRLDSLYGLYQQNKYEDYVQKTYTGKRHHALYAQNEIFQLGFRAAKKAGLPSLSAIDYEMPMPFDTVMNAIKIAKQDDVAAEIDSFIATQGAKENLKRKTMGLTDMILDLNTAASRHTNSGFYIKTLNRAGKTDNFGGAYSVSEWYKRNLYMFALMQKQVQNTDQRTVMILGAGHVAMIKKFIEEEGIYEVVELRDLLKK